MAIPRTWLLLSATVIVSALAACSGRLPPPPAAAATDVAPTPAAVVDRAPHVVLKSLPAGTIQVATASPYPSAATADANPTVRDVSWRLLGLRPDGGAALLEFELDPGCERLETVLRAEGATQLALAILVRQTTATCEEVAVTRRVEVPLDAFDLTQDLVHKPSDL